MHLADAQKQADWLSACRRAATATRAMLADRTTTVERARETGSTGGGGDLTLEIDHAAEEIVFAELRRLHDAGSRFSAISEERGAVDFGGGEVLVVIDPIDGSLNAKRGIVHHALSVAVANGKTMADVEFGYVYEFGTSEEWSAQRGAGAFLNGQRLDREANERRTPDGRLEMLGIESADPRWLTGMIDSLADRAYRLRAFGALAPSLCQVAASRFDALMSLRGCRAVDVAAAQLIVEEAGGCVGFPMFEDPLAAPLDLVPHSPIVAARTASTLADLEALCRRR
jgi:myo-inositol-1(or 4)-monophosphatase